MQQQQMGGAEREGERRLKEEHQRLAQSMDNYYQSNTQAAFAELKNSHRKEVRTREACGDRGGAAAGEAWAAEEEKLWEKERAALTAEAEKGYRELYSEITEKTNGVVTNLGMGKEAGCAGGRKSQGERLADVTGDEDRLREVQQRCDELVQKYRDIAEEATRSAAEDRQRMQMEMLERRKEDDVQRAQFEEEAVRKSADAVREAQQRALEATQLLERERENFTKLEVMSPSLSIIAASLKMWARLLK